LLPETVLTASAIASAAIHGFKRWYVLGVLAGRMAGVSVVRATERGRSVKTLVSTDAGMLEEGEEGREEMPQAR
jgi:hypothetical protein